MSEKSSTIKIDKNNRINLPKFASAKENDRLVPRIDPSGDFVVLYPEDYFEQRSEEVLESIHNDVKDGILTPAEERELIRCNFGKLSFPAVKVDSHRRCLLYPEILEKLKLNGSLYFVNNDNNTMALYKDEDTYKKSNVR